MAKVYVRKIRDGEMTLADVPSRFRAEVERLLAE